MKLLQRLWSSTSILLLIKPDADVTWAAGKYSADSAIHSDVYFNSYTKGLGSPAETQTIIDPSSQQLYLSNSLSLNVALAYLFSPSSN
jgi:hypothetical protein